MEVMSIEDTATFFNVTRQTIDNWLHAGSLPRSVTVKIGRRVYVIKEKLTEFIISQAEK